VLNFWRDKLWFNDYIKTFTQWIKIKLVSLLYSIFQLLHPTKFNPLPIIGTRTLATSKMVKPVSIPYYDFPANYLTNHLENREAITRETEILTNSKVNILNCWSTQMHEQFSHYGSKEYAPFVLHLYLAMNSLCAHSWPRWSSFWALPTLHRFLHFVEDIGLPFQ